MANIKLSYSPKVCNTSVFTSSTRSIATSLGYRRSSPPSALLQAPLVGPQVPSNTPAGLKESTCKSKCFKADTTQ